MINIGIVGAGGMGTVHYNNYKYINDCCVKAVVGISESDRKKAEEWKLPIFPTIRDMIAGEEIDVVDICTPTFLHKDHVMESLSLKRHTIVEKPIALSYKDAEAMIYEAEKSECLLFVAQVVQFTKETQILRSLVNSKRFGKVHDAYFERLSSCPEWTHGSWLFDKSKSGLIPYDLHIHDLDMIVSIFGKPHSFEAMKDKREESSYPEHYRIIYKYSNMNITAEASWFHSSFPFTARWRVVFDNAVVVYDGSSLNAYPYHGNTISFRIEDDVKIPTGINVPPTGWYYNELRHFIECIKAGSQSPYVTKEQLLEVMRILEKISE